jgi:hypothetical protein
MARFGLLYLRDGRWDDAQVVPADWVARSLEPHSRAFADGTGYGFLWWHYRLDGYEVSYASGAPGQGIYLIPELDAVFVFRPNTFGRANVSDQQTRTLLRRIIDARVSSPGARPEDLVAAVWPERLPDAKPVNPERLAPHFGSYGPTDVGMIELGRSGDGVVLSLNRGSFRVLEESSALVIEDIEGELRIVEQPDRAGGAEFTVIDGRPGFVLYADSRG